VAGDSDSEADAEPAAESPAAESPTAESPAAESLAAESPVAESTAPAPEPAAGTDLPTSPSDRVADAGPQDNDETAHEATKLDGRMARPEPIEHAFGAGSHPAEAEVSSAPQFPSDDPSTAPEQ
jgi:hypothetical protein